MTPTPAPGTVDVRPNPAAVRMNAGERRATTSLAAIYGLRLLGMFVILPVFALYAETLDGGASHTLIGIALGAYGLTQAILQIPFGWASDRWGRKPVIYGGLAIFAVGSFVAAAAHTIEWVIIGRCLQGAGAISAAVISLTADLTRDSVRTRAMAIIGITIAATFAVSLVAGPILKAAIGVPGIFALTGLLAVGAIIVVRVAVPDPGPVVVASESTRKQLLRVLVDPHLLRLNYGTFALHAVLMALFTQLPFAMVDLGLVGDRHWVVYLPVLLLSVVLMLPFLRQVDRVG
ncbi:MAG: MFS transporter, partial [Betaproteobacteria bacterium]